MNQQQQTDQLDWFHCTGTDATIAEHIAKIIERAYVEPRQSGGQKYLVPSDLGIGLVEGYNRIGFDRSLTKPHLRREVSDWMWPSDADESIDN